MEQLMKRKNWKNVNEVIKLGSGIVVFKSRIDVNKQVVPFLQSIKDDAKKRHYTFINDNDGNPIYAVNKSGHRFDIDEIDKNCSRITDFYNYFNSEEIKDFFIYCQKIIYNTLLEYISIYPMSIPCLWWKTMGHVLAYGSGSDLGLHCDNDINYRPGFEPDYQLGIRHVLACITYFNSSVDIEDSENFVGGELYFPYEDATYKPERGDILMFPANYVAAHEVLPVTHGNRYAYLEYFGQGSSDEQRGINISPPNGDFLGGQVWLSSLFDDYRQYIIDKHGQDYDSPMLRPVGRKYHSQNTKQEVADEI